MKTVWPIALLLVGCGDVADVAHVEVRAGTGNLSRPGSSLPGSSCCESEKRYLQAVREHDPGTARRL
jgi:hypothetical protein